MLLGVTCGALKKNEDSVLSQLGRFDLVTANPPYIPIEDKKLPAHSQRRHCYYELRGGVFDFAAAAARVLKPDGRFCHWECFMRLKSMTLLIYGRCSTNHTYKKKTLHA